MQVNPCEDEKRRKRYAFVNEEMPVVVHRSANRIIIAGDSE